MNTHMKKYKFLYLILTAILVFFAMLSITYYLQTNSTLKNQRKNSAVKLEIAENRIQDNKREEVKDWKSYDSFMQAKANTIALTIDLKGNSGRKSWFLNVLVREWGLKGLYICENQVISAGIVPITEHTISKFQKGANFDSDKSIGVCFYASNLDDGTMIVIAQDSERMLRSEDYLISVQNALGNIKVGNSGYIVAYDTPEGEAMSLAYGKDNSIFGSDEAVEKIGALSKNYTGWVDVLGESYYTSVKDLDEYRLLAVVPKSEIRQSVKRSVSVANTVFGSALIILLFYSIFLFFDIQKAVVKRKDLRKKFKLVTCVSLLCIFLFTFYAWALVVFSDSMEMLGETLQSVEYIINQNDGKTERITKDYEQQYIERAHSIAFTLKECPELLNENGLKSLATSMNLNSIYVFNELGEVVETNTVFSDFKLSKNENDQSFEFWNIIRGYDDFIIQEAREDDTAKHSLVQYVGVKRLDSPGMVQIGIAPERLEERLYGDSLEAVLDNIAVEDQGFIYSESDDASKVSNNIGFIKRNNKRYLYSQRIINEKSIVVCKPIAFMLLEGIRISAIICAFCALFFILIIFILMSISHGDAVEGEPKFSNAGTAGSRLSGAGIPWKSLNAEDKISRILFVVLSAIALTMIIYVSTRGGEDNNIINYIMSKDWEKEISIFSLSYVLNVTIEVLFATSIIRRLILSFSIDYGARAETIGRLFNSVIKYVSLIGLIFYGLYQVGFDVKTLLASAGLLTLGLSLGAQSLVSDILAGMFIVFEGDFRVGDIVTIGDFRGRVREIGIRTTKVENIGNDLKIFRNSSINDVINMTRKYSFATAKCGIEYGESIEHVESILKKELPKIKEKLPSIVDGPFYKGVVELGESSVVIMIVAQCHESDRLQLEMDLNRQLKLIFDNNNIGIPFPQIVLNQPETKKHATKKEKEDAEIFINEQKEKSKDTLGQEED